MPAIARVRDPRLPNLNYGWMFIIRSWVDLEGWWSQVRMGKSAQEFRDACKTVAAGADAGHAAEGGWIIGLAVLTGDSLVNTLATLNQRTHNGMATALEEKGAIAINGKGGYMTLSPDHELLYEHDIKTFVLPIDKIEILQWPGGVHWYAKYGDIDVVWQDRQKWSTKREAELAAKKFQDSLK